VAPAAPDRAARRRRRLSYRETKELEALPARIEAAEGEQEDINAVLAAPETYQAGNVDKVTTLSRRLAELEAELETMYARWEALEEHSA
jgi:ATP-binding cassette subfamily F protein uup